jgi:phage terminase large subunit-like protein
MIQRLQEHGVLIEEFPQTQGNTIKMGEALFTTITDKNLVAYESAELKEHVTNAVGQETANGVRMVKSKASKKIDLAIALAMAIVAALKSPGAIDFADLWAGGQRVFSGAPEDDGIISIGSVGRGRFSDLDF